MNNYPRFTPCTPLVLAFLCSATLSWAGPPALCENVVSPGKVSKVPSSITVRTVATGKLMPGIQLLGQQGERVTVGSLSDAHSYAFEDDLRRHWTHRVDWSVYEKTDAVPVSRQEMADESVRLFFGRDAQGTERLCQVEMPESMLDWQFLQSLDSHFQPAREPQQAPRWVLRFAYGANAQLIGVRTSKDSDQAVASLVQATCLQRDPISSRVQSITSTVGKDCSGNVKGGAAFRQMHVYDDQGRLLRTVSSTQPRVKVHGVDGAVTAAYFTDRQQRPFRVALSPPSSCDISELLERARSLDRLVVIGDMAKPFTWEEYGGPVAASQPWEIFEYSPQGVSGRTIARGVTGRAATVQLSAPVHAALYAALKKASPCVTLKSGMAGMGVTVDFLPEIPASVWRACTDVGNTNASACS